MKPEIQSETLNQILSQIPAELKQHINTYAEPWGLTISFMYENGYGASCICKDNKCLEICISKQNHRGLLNVSDKEFYDSMEWDIDYNNPITEKYRITYDAQSEQFHQYDPIYVSNIAKMCEILKDVKELDDHALIVYEIKQNLNKITNMVKSTIELVRELNK